MLAVSQTHLKHTALYDRHVALGGKMVDFAGFHLPIYYASIMKEHLNVREKAGLFDVSHLGEIRIAGSEALSFLERMVPTDLGPLDDGQILYSIVLNEKGGIQDDILIYRETSERFYLVVNAANIEKIFEHLKTHAPKGLEISNESDACSCIAIQGPQAENLCAKIFDRSLMDLKYYHFRTLPGHDEKVWVSRSGYTGEDGFEFFADNERIVKLWDLIIKEGQSLGLVPCGLGARNTLRLEVGNGLYGADFDETTSPFEVRLGWLVTSQKDFIGKEAVLKIKEAGPKRRLVGFLMKDKAVARDGYGVFKNDRQIGKVTSGSFSPSLKANLGLALLEKEDAKVGSLIQIEVHQRKVAAEIVKLPFLSTHHK